MGTHRCPTRTQRRCFLADGIPWLAATISLTNQLAEHEGIGEEIENDHVSLRSHLREFVLFIFPSPLLYCIFEDVKERTAILIRGTLSDISLDEIGGF